MIDAQEAYRIGLVNEVVPAADLLARVGEGDAGYPRHGTACRSSGLEAV